VIVSDNGTQFTSGTFQVFCKNNGIHHKLSAPYHPNTNGEAKWFVQTFKTAMKTGQGNLQTTLCQFLIQYHISPHTVTGKTPAAMMFNREITTRLSLLFPRSNQQNKEQSNNKNEQACSFKCNNPVWGRK